MKNTKVARIRQKVAMLKQQFLQSGTGLFDQVLGEDEIQTIVQELIEPHRERIYSPLDTLRLFVGQVLSADRACQDVVGRRLTERVAQGQKQSALGTSAYCEARLRLPTALPVTLREQIGSDSIYHQAACQTCIQTRNSSLTPIRTSLAAAPHWSACMAGSKSFPSPSPDSPLACHKRKLPAGVTLNSIR
jgi:hypothetical protein